MLRLSKILGYASEPAIAERLHTLQHDGQIETIVLTRTDAQRHRLRTTTDHGTEVAIALERSESLGDGAVLSLTDDRAVVVRMAEETWLRFIPRDAAAALELGYHAGNLHWRVRFADGVLEVACEGPEASYLDRLQPLLASRRIRKVHHDESV
jgi:urease accessory protein